MLWRIFLVLVIGFLGSSVAQAVVCNQSHCTVLTGSDCVNATEPEFIMSCATSSTDNDGGRCYERDGRRYFINDCATCNISQGFVKKQVPIEDACCGNAASILHWVCVKEETCTAEQKAACLARSDNDFVNILSLSNPGYMKKETYSFNNSTCQCLLSRTDYQCAMGFYGIPISSTQGCNQCPSDATNTNTSAAGAQDVKECYVTKFIHDGVGSGYFVNTDKCYYK